MAREMMVRHERHRLNSRNRRFVQLYVMNSERHSDLPSSLDATKRYPFSLSRPVTSLRQHVQCVVVTPNNVLSLLHFLLERWIVGSQLISAFRPINQKKPIAFICFQSAHSLPRQYHAERIPDFLDLELHQRFASAAITIVATSSGTTARRAPFTNRREFGEDEPIAAVGETVGGLDVLTKAVEAFDT
jgi:hypothetical protein